MFLLHYNTVFLFFVGFFFFLGKRAKKYARRPLNGNETRDVKSSNGLCRWSVVAAPRAGRASPRTYLARFGAPFLQSRRASRSARRPLRRTLSRRNAPCPGYSARTRPTSRRYDLADARALARLFVPAVLVLVHFDDHVVRRHLEPGSGPSSQLIHHTRKRARVHFFLFCCETMALTAHRRGTSRFARRARSSLLT